MLLAFKGKSFPHYDTLFVIFGKDRVTSTVAESFEDAIEEIGKEEAIEWRASKKKKR